MQKNVTINKATVFVTINIKKKNLTTFNWESKHLQSKPTHGQELVLLQMLLYFHRKHKDYTR